MAIPITLGALFVAASLFMIAAPNTINRFDNAKRRAVLGDGVPPLKNRPVGQRIAGIVLFAAGTALIIVGSIK